MLPRRVLCFVFLPGKVFAGPTNMTKYVAPKCTLYCFLQGKVLAWPTHMTHDVAPMCTVYCFFAKESVRRANTYDQICCSEMYFVLFFLKGKVLAWPTHTTHDVAPKCTSYCFCRGWWGGLAWCRHGFGLAPSRLGERVFINREQC